MRERVLGSIWEQKVAVRNQKDYVETSVLLRIKSCPEGYVLVRSSTESGLQAGSIDDCAQ